jgi:hypothetical protein
LFLEENITREKRTPYPPPPKKKTKNKTDSVSIFHQFFRVVVDRMLVKNVLDSSKEMENTRVPGKNLAERQ